MALTAKPALLRPNSDEDATNREKISHQKIQMYSLFISIKAVAYMDSALERFAAMIAKLHEHFKCCL
jgi:hypothetical protein